MLEGGGAQAGELQELLEGIPPADLHFQGHVRHFIGDHPRQAPVFRVIGSDPSQLGGHPVGDLAAQLQDLLPGLGVLGGDGKGQLAFVQRHIAHWHFPHFLRAFPSGEEGRTLFFIWSGFRGKEINWNLPAGRAAKS